MKSIYTGGLLIGILCGLWTILMGVTGWYKDPLMLMAFWFVIVIQIGVLIWGLRKSALEKNYWQQVLAGTVMSAIGGVILFFVSLLFTTVLYPNYFEELRAVQAELLKNAGKSEAEIEAELALTAQSQTSFIQAISGFFGTVVTGFVVSLVLSAFFRKK